MAHLRRKGEWLDEASEPTTTDDPLLLEEPALASVYQASLRGRIFMGERHGFKVVRIQGASASGGSYKRGVSGNAFNFYAGVLIEFKYPKQLEKLLRSMFRLPLANDRLEILPGGDVLLRLKRPYSDGTTHLRFTPTGNSENRYSKTRGSDSQTAKSPGSLSWGVYAQCPVEKRGGGESTQIQKRGGE